LKKQLLALSTAAAVAAGCASKQQPAPSEPAPAPVTAAAPAPAPAPAEKPELGTFGFDIAGMDRQQSPGDNWTGFANGTWTRTTQIPADRSRYGMFNVLDDRAREQNRAIIE
jgi:putative endopeptidase